MKHCITNKKMYQSHELGVQALIDAWTQFDYRPGRGPVAVYKCDDCGFYHLTSQGRKDETLEKHLATGKIKLQKEADSWTEKLKKR